LENKNKKKKKKDRATPLGKIRVVFRDCSTTSKEQNGGSQNHPKAKKEKEKLS